MRSSKPDGSRRYPTRSRSARTTMTISYRFARPQPFSDSSEWRTGDRGEEGRPARRRHAERLLPRRSPRRAGWRRDHPSRESALHELRVDELVICGLATDYCVRATALDALRRGMPVRVLRDAIRGVDLKPGDSEIAVKEMRVHGARFSESRALVRRLPKP